MMSNSRFSICGFRFMFPNIRRSASCISRSKMLFFLLLLMPIFVRADRTPRQWMKKGLKHYEQGAYSNALQALEKTTLKFPALGNYNLGNTQYRLKNFQAAEDAYRQALRTTDLDLQSRAYFNLGNSLLAQTTRISDQQEIDKAIDLTLQAMEMYESALLLNPEDPDAKQNHERAWMLWKNLEFNKGRYYFEKAEALLKEYKAKDARENYLKAREQFNYILKKVNPEDEESKQLLARTTERLEMLRKAVEDTEKALTLALRYIDDYQYKMAAKLLTTETDTRKYAFDLKPELKKKFEETAKKNQQILKIIRECTSLNMAI